MGKHKLVIFDLDGTILDTLDDLTDSVNHALESCGFPGRSIEEVRCFVGNGIRNLMIRAVPEGTDPSDEEKAFGVFRDYYKTHSMIKTRPYAGICQLMEKLKEEGYRIAVVSNKADFAVQDLCLEFFPGLIDYAAGERENVRRKPAPDSVFATLETLGFDREAAVYVGDSEVDVETAHNAGVDCISVTWGFRSRELLENKGAKMFAENCEELGRILLRR